MSATLRLECTRIDCDRIEIVDVEWFDESLVVRAFMPDGWGWDRHDGVHHTLHCPAHRNPPTPEEIEAIHKLGNAGS